MTRSTRKSSFVENVRTPENKGALVEKAPQADPQYDSALKPLLWLLIPFVALLVYGYLS